jgi:hypothetical protein
MKNKILSLPMLKFLDFTINGVLVQDGHLIVFEKQKTSITTTEVGNS